MSACYQETCPNWTGGASCFQDDLDDCRDVNEPEVCDYCGEPMTACDGWTCRPDEEDQ